MYFLQLRFTFLNSAELKDLHVELYAQWNCFFYQSFLPIDYVVFYCAMCLRICVRLIVSTIVHVLHVHVGTLYSIQ